MTKKIIFVLISLHAAALFALPAYAQQQQPKVQISGMRNIDFGTVATLGADSTRSLNLCVYSISGRYGVTAIGDGPAGTFAMSSITSTLPYQVEWAAVSGQTSGQVLIANSRLSGQSTVAERKDCSRGPPTTATLIVRLRAANLATARAGDYSGGLTVVIAGE